MYECPFDNSTLADSHLDEQEDELEKCPKCDLCGEPIQEDYAFDPFEDGNLICPRCIEESKIWLD